MALRKASFFFAIPRDLTDKGEKHLVRSFAVGTHIRENKFITRIEEKRSEADGRYFNIYGGRQDESETHHKVWKEYTSRISDVELEYDI